jgi:hypothetical protein
LDLDSKTGKKWDQKIRKTRGYDWIITINLYFSVISGEKWGIK